MSVFPGRFDGRVAFVTGGASGIGAAVSERFIAEGGRVAVLDRNESMLQSHVSEIEKSGGEALGFAGDVTSVRDIENAVSRVIGVWGQIDVLVNNAAVRHVNTVVDMTDDQFHEVVNVNLFGAFACTRAIAPGMVARNYGRIINVSSRSYLGEPRMSIYSASKAALHGFTSTVALELGPHGITINAVAPGGVLTPMRRQHSDYEARTERLMRTTPVRWIAEPSDLAAAILFVASEEAGYITGAVIPVTGGRYSSSAPHGLL